MLGCKNLGNAALEHVPAYWWALGAATMDAHEQSSHLAEEASGVVLPKCVVMMTYTSKWRVCVTE